MKLIAKIKKLKNLTKTVRIYTICGCFGTFIDTLLGTRLDFYRLFGETNVIPRTLTK